MADTDLLVVSRDGVSYKVTRAELDAYLDAGYKIDDSLRFNADDSAYLTRTNATKGTFTTFTVSTWIKRGAISVASSYQTFFGSNTGTNAFTLLGFDDNDNLNWRIRNSSGVDGTKMITTQAFRDPSAWYHIVLQFDTTESTALDRDKLWVNGEQITSFNSANTTALNSGPSGTTLLNPQIGRTNINSSKFYYADEYLSDYNFIDGQALEPSNFGKTNDDGVWIPKAYTGTYGTNGFFLQAQDSVDLGKDTSGNDNNFTNTNVEQVTDVPTLTNTDTANFAVMNPLNSSTGVTLKNANLTVVMTSSQSSSATIKPTSGKWYWELPITVSSTGNYIGIKDADSTATTYTADALGCNRTGDIYFNLANTGKNGTLGWAGGVGDIIAVAWDADDKKVWWSKNGQWYTANAASAVAIDIAEVVAGNFGYDYSSQLGNSGPYIGGSDSGTNIDINFGQQPFAYTPPTGFKKLNTFNLADSAIKDGSTNFNTVLYTGDNVDGREITGVGFSPEFVWGKSRTNTYNHFLYDILRGTGNSLASSTSSETLVENPSGYLSAFGEDGFTSTKGSSTSDNINKLNSKYVAWNWKAGGSAVLNEEGTIDSQVSANPTARFSVVTYGGNSTSGATVGHGLEVVPDMVIVKNRTGSSGFQNWGVYHSSLLNTQAVFLNTSGAVTASTTYWNNTTPTANVFSLGYTGTDGWNITGQNFVAYCFADVEGYSKSGTYIGNGNVDGTFVYTGFKPAYVMIKKTTGTGSWLIYDDARAPVNSVGNILYADTTGAENSVTDRMDFVSNGIKLRTNDASHNANGQTYIYMAFAENPFKNSTAR